MRPSTAQYGGSPLRRWDLRGKTAATHHRLFSKLSSTNRRHSSIVRATRPARAAAAAAEAVELSVGRTQRDGSRQVSARVRVYTSEDALWEVLTNYTRLHHFLPNLELSERVPCKTPGCVRIRQVGVSQSLFWRLQATVTLELREVERECGRRELLFNMVEGDFDLFQGKWYIKRTSNCSHACTLCYEVQVRPKRNDLPGEIVHRLVQLHLPRNLGALAARAEEVAAVRASAPDFAQLEALVSTRRSDALAERLGIHTGPERAGEGGDASSACKSYLGINEVPIPGTSSAPTVNSDLNPAPRMLSLQLPTAPQSPLRPVKSQVATTVPAFWFGDDEEDPLERSTEVHLRRLDDDKFVHRRAVAMTRIKATKEDVWNVLSDYEALPEFVPNLVRSERVQPIPGADVAPGAVRLRQVGAKLLPYMSIHTEVVLDLIEKDRYGSAPQIQFRLVEGEFHKLQGKWLIQENDEGMETQLKYAVEVVIEQDRFHIMKTLEPLLERILYTELPITMAAIRERVEMLAVRKELAPRSKPTSSRSLSPEQKQFRQDEVLKRLERELQMGWGENQVMPRREDLRKVGRLDLEKAITAAGGFPVVAEKLGWRLAYKSRKPRGYWTSLDNMRLELKAFAEQEGLEDGKMPTRLHLQRAGRYDIARALEKWGGGAALARRLDLKVSPKRRKSRWNEHVAEVATRTGLQGKELFRTASKTYVKSTPVAKKERTRSVSNL